MPRPGTAFQPPLPPSRIQCSVPFNRPVPSCSCYCPVYRANKYLLGSPNGDPASCKPSLPYVLSGVAVY